MLTNLNVRITFDKIPSECKWLFRCACGRETKAVLGHVKCGKTKQCKICRRAQQGHTLSRFVFGIRVTSHELYFTWRGMHGRCTLSNHISYDDYGGRGIKVCPRWDSFECFVNDMGPKPTPSHTLDRIDNDGNYQPDNCRWATAKEQNNNKRNTKRK